MRIALLTEECGGFVRHLPVQNLDSATRLEAEKRFRDYQKSGAVCRGAFSDNVWTLTNELQKYALDFNFDSEVFERKAKVWVGCTSECYQECMKAYISLLLGNYTLSYLQLTLSHIKAIAGMEREDAEMFSCCEQVRMIEFLSLIPTGNDLRDSVIESLEERRFVTRKSSPRELADFSHYLRFNKELNRFWSMATAAEKRFYFPIYFWWSLTSILPLRVTEFLLTPRNCIRRTGERFLLSIRRSRMKKGGRALRYTIKDDYELEKYEIPEWMFQEIQSYQSVTEKDSRLKPLDTLLAPERVSESGYFTYVQLERRLKHFCAEVIGDENIPVRAGDTRHLSMINLILSGGSPVICRELAGHESVAVSSHYYANLSSIIESAVYNQFHGWSTGFPMAGSPRHPAALPEKKIRVGDGWCDASNVALGEISECLKSYDRNGQIGNCVNCPHFYPDSPGLRLKLERAGKKAVDEDSQYLMRMIELVRKGLGLKEEIGEALLRLQSSGYHYSVLLSRKRMEEDWHGKTP